MIIINLRGGLGNQMFQYATGLNISNKNNVPAKLDLTGYQNFGIIKRDTFRTFDLINFNISKLEASTEEISKLKYPLGIISKIFIFLRSKIFRQFYVDYHPNILKKKNYYLNGFWQSEKNFLKIRPLLLKEFTLKNESNNYKILSDSLSSDSLSIHVRRGDYVNDQKTNKYHGVLDIKYYKNAFDILKDKINQVVIFTDDPIWVKENFDFINKPKIYVSDSSLSAPEELTLMSKCHHNIIANSSFSWWGAWLNQNPDKIIIAPKIWFKKRGGKHKNIVPTSWTQI